MIHRILIKNYRGIELREAEIPPAGAIVEGRNGSGKTSTIRALEAALLGRDIGPDAIRIGAEKAEILVDFDDATVKRVITAEGSKLSAKSTLGDIYSKPAEFLKEVFGASIDPLALLLAKPKDRRATVLAALPCTITADEIRAKWVPDLAANYDCSGHGFEVIARLRENYYDRRKDANASAKRLRTEADRLSVEAAGMPAGIEGVTVDAAEDAAFAARTEAAKLSTRADMITAAQKRTAAAQARIAELRATYAAKHAKPEAIEAARRVVLDHEAAVRDLEERLRNARETLAQHEAGLRDLEASERAAQEARREGEQLAQVLAASGPEPIPEGAIEAAARAVSEAERTVEGARQAAARRAANERANAADAKAKAAEDEAKRLDGIVDALTNDAPRALAATGIRGLTLEGDDVLLDGVRFSAVNTAAQVRFAVEIAKRANARGRVLIVDGLERIDPEQLDVFLAEATADGWQLIATRVERGDIRIEAISAPEAQAAE